jgi:hypothetical protein
VRRIQALAIVGLMLGSPYCIAQSVFDGTWRPDPQKADSSQKPDVLEIGNGVYDCKSCIPPYKVKADGHDQPVVGNPYYDTMSISIIDDRTVMKIGKKHGRTAVEATVVVSADGSSATETQRIFGMGPSPMKFTSESSRVSAGRQGAHALSGGWQLVETDLTNHDEDTTYKISGDALTMSDRMGRSFTARLDGTDVPYKGDPQYTSVSVKMIDSRTMEESDKKGGKVVQINRWSVSPDGQTIHASFDNTKGKVQHQDGHKVRRDAD